MEFFNCAGCETELTEDECQFGDSGRIFCGIDCLYTSETPTFKKCAIEEPYSYPVAYLSDFADHLTDDIQCALNSQQALKVRMTENPESVDVKLDQISEYDPLLEDYKTEVKSFHEKKLQEELTKIESNICELESLMKQVIKDRESVWTGQETYRLSAWTGKKTYNTPNSPSARLVKARSSYNEKRLRIIDTTKTDTEILADAVQYAKQLRQQKPM